MRWKKNDISGARRHGVEENNSSPFLKIAIVIIVGVAVLIIAFCLLRSCSKTDEGAAESAATVIPEDLARGFVRLPYNTALIVYVAGEVEKCGFGSTFLPADAGEYMVRGERIKTGASSSCEIQLDDDSIVVVGEKTEIVIDEFDTRPLSAVIAFSMSSGVSLHKVDRIDGLESYIVRAPGAACFAQGGRFMATARDSGETLVSVREGSVYLHPADVTIIPRSRRGRKTDKKIAELMDRLPSNAPAVSSGLEVVIGGVPEAASRSGIFRFDEELNRAASLKKAGPAEIARLAESAKAYRLSIQGNIQGSTPLSSAAALKIDWLDRLPALPIARLKTPSPSVGGSPAISLIEVTVEPEDASISLYGQAVGRKIIRALAIENVDLLFDVRLSGYEDASLTVHVTAADERSFHIILKRIPKEIRTGAQMAKKSPSPASIAIASPEASPEPSPTPTDTAPATFDLLIEYGGHRYYLSRETMTWLAAKARCERMGGHLVTLTTLGESRAIVKALNRWAAKKEAWIGLSDEEREGYWTWVTGEKFTYADWFSGEPNDHLSKEDCAVLTRQRGDFAEDAYQWNDVDASTLAYYILEID